MVKNTMFLLIIVLILLIPNGCSQRDAARPQDDEKIAADYVKALGCKIITHEGETSRYTLESEMFHDLNYMLLWAVQKTDPVSYVGKEIVTYNFVVKGHPLEKKYGSIYKKKNYDTSVMIMLVDGKVIGGGSIPKSRNNVLMLGGYYAVDGEDLETVTGLSYLEWLDQWNRKYGQEDE